MQAMAETKGNKKGRATGRSTTGAKALHTQQTAERGEGSREWRSPHSHPSAGHQWSRCTRPVLVNRTALKCPSLLFPLWFSSPLPFWGAFNLLPPPPPPSASLLPRCCVQQLLGHAQTEAQEARERRERMLKERDAEFRAKYSTVRTHALVRTKQRKGMKGRKGFGRTKTGTYKRQCSVADMKHATQHRQATARNHVCEDTFLRAKQPPCSVPGRA